MNHGLEHRIFTAFLMLMAVFALPQTALGVDDEIVVFSDPFAQWDDTRWFVQVEQVNPQGLALSADKSVDFWAQAFQTRTVFTCNKQWRLGKKSWEVDCRIEDFAILATGRYANVGPRRIERINRMLAEIDSKLTGARLQLQVGRRGTVRNIDIEGLPENNREQLRLNEALRQMLSGVAAGFHLKLEKGHLAAGQWVESNSRLMAIPSSQGSGGSSRLEHTVSRHEGDFLVQSEGRGSLSVPYAPWEARFGGHMPSTGAVPPPPEFSGGSSNGASLSAGVKKLTFAKVPTPDIGDKVQEVPPNTPLEVVYSAQFSGVALYDSANGILTERVWAMVAQPTSSSVVSGTVWHTGRFRQIGNTETIDVGPTQLVAAPKQSTTHLPAWTPLNQQ